jgi:hypothetical protein
MQFMTDDVEIIKSAQCQTVEQDGKKVRIEIYRLADSAWTLEVYDDFNNSTVWEDPFDSEDEALYEALATIKEDGIDCLIGPPDSGFL